jgi:hypothetical protein
MIAQVLNRDFLLEITEELRKNLEGELKGRAKPRRRGGAPTEMDEVETDELEEAVAKLEADTRDREQLEVASEGGAPSDAEGERPKDDFAFVPRSPLLSVIQTLMEEHIEDTQDLRVTERALLDDKRGGEEPAVTDLQLADLPLTRTASGRRKWGDMEIAKRLLLSDPGWLTSGFAMAVRAVRHRATFIERPVIVPIANDAKVIVVGDWGSGIPRAKKVADRIREELDRDTTMQRSVVHLGDVYYSGSKREYERNMLNLWPVRAGEDIRSFSLMGNHDMYYGGHAYYGTCLTDSRFSAQAGCSYFALQSDDWQILGLDTGHEDGGLRGDQAGWAKRVIEEPEEKSGKDRMTALLTHHQLFSAHEPGAKELGKKMKPVLETGRLDAWLWGHEHRCIQYEATEWQGDRIGFASCVGHGGIPEYLVMKEGETKPKPWVYEYLKRYGTAKEPWETFGFAVLELRGRDMRVRYVDEDGNEHHRVESVVAGR